MKNPTVFISYSWEDNEHNEWVKLFADKLISDGVDAKIDQYDLTLGDRLPLFMEQSIISVDYVLIICTPNYKKKSDARIGGVGYEGHIISDELLTTRNERKFIPIIRKGNISTALPNCLKGKYGIDLNDSEQYADNYRDLITTIYGERKKPKLGVQPKYIASFDNKQIDKSVDEPISILGIITDEVTVPKLDGSRGSALYKIPFRLSRTPSSLWCKLFINAWSCPPSFSTMHRFGIASVVGDKIILDGTTIEEVRDYHRKTLLLCVDEANKKENIVLKEIKEKIEREEIKRKKHYENLNSVIDDIKF